MRPRALDPPSDPVTDRGVAARSTAARWGTVAAVFAGTVILHLPVSDLCDAVIRRVGFPAVDGASRTAAALAGAALVAAVWRRSGRRARQTSAAALLVVGAAAASRWLLVSGLEAAHYPQYAVMFLLLRRAGLRSPAAWLAALTLGLVDEAYQYLALSRGTPAYYDWNDVVLDGTGAMCGWLVSRATGAVNSARRPARRAAVPSVAALAAVLVEWGARGTLLAAAPTGQPAVVLTLAQAALAVSLLWWLAAVATRGPETGRAATPVRPAA